MSGEIGPADPKIKEAIKKAAKQAAEESRRREIKHEITLPGPERNIKTTLQRLDNEGRKVLFEAPGRRVAYTETIFEEPDNEITQEPEETKTPPIEHTDGINTASPTVHGTGDSASETTQEPLKKETLPELAFETVQKPPMNPFMGLKYNAFGYSSKNVKKMQEALKRWAPPALKKRIKIDGVYGEDTAALVGLFKIIYGFGSDGHMVDENTAGAILDIENGNIENGSFWKKDENGRRPYRKTSDGDFWYRCAEKRGFPLIDEGASLTGEEIEFAADYMPRRLITYQGFTMQTKAAREFINLKRFINSKFPGYRFIITCTTGGRHLSPAHPEGRAVDFIVINEKGYGITNAEAARIADLARQQGLTTHDEYNNFTPLRTGPHIHVEVD